MYVNQVKQNLGHANENATAIKVRPPSINGIVAWDSGEADTIIYG
jgi:hypothetical protein